MLFFVGCFWLKAVGVLVLAHAAFWVLGYLVIEIADLESFRVRDRQ